MICRKVYAPKEVIRMLNEVKEELLCVRGNCEADVDQMVLEFPVMADYCVLQLEDTGVVFCIPRTCAQSSVYASAEERRYFAERAYACACL
mgnify:CR=1 FL=1